MSRQYEATCKYLGGYPYLEETGEAEVRITDDGIIVLVKGETSVEGERATIPARAIETAMYHEEHLGFEQAEIEEDVLLGPTEWLIRHTVVLRVKDREGVMPKGFRVRFSFHSDYHAKVFEKHCREAFRLAPF